MSDIVRVEDGGRSYTFLGDDGVSYPVEVFGTPDQPQFSAPDLGRVLGVQNLRQVLAKFDDDEKGVCTAYTLGGKQSVATVYEPGLYRLLSISRKPVAKKFQRWVFHEVLPSIRKTGSYGQPKTEPALVPYTRRCAFMHAVKAVLPAGHWCVFVEAAQLLIDAEKVLIPAGLTMEEDDLLDGSVGIRWGTYRQDKAWAVPESHYPHTFPADFVSGRAGKTYWPKCYRDSELLHFRRWLDGEYVCQHLPPYLATKYHREGVEKILAAGTSKYLGIERQMREVLPLAKSEQKVLTGGKKRKCDPDG